MFISKLKKTTRKTALMTVLVLYALVTILPLVWIGYTSLKTNNEVFMNPWALPKVPQFSNYLFAWEKAKMGIYMKNSVLIAVVCSVLALGLSSTAAYGISRFNTKVSKFAFGYFMFGILVPINTVLIPLYVLMSKLHLLDSIFTIIIAYTVFALPMSIFLFTAGFSTIPSAIEEAAVIDGCNMFQVFYLIMLPITKPIMATVTIINVLTFWNEYILALLFTSSDSIRTLPVGLANFQGQYEINYSVMAAGIMIAILPTIIIFIIMQEKVINGMTAGAVKG